LSAPTDNQIYAVRANPFSPSPGTTLVGRLPTGTKALCPMATCIVHKTKIDEGQALLFAFEKGHGSYWNEVPHFAWYFS